MNVRLFVILLFLLPALGSGQSPTPPASAGNPSAVKTKPSARSGTDEERALARLREAVEKELSGPLFARCLAAVEISDADRGDVLLAREENLLLRPASNAKLVTTAAALLALPSDFMFETRIARGDAAGRTLVCLGGGDPLTSEQDIQKLAEIAASSLTAPIDTLVMDGSLFGDDVFGEGWMWDDETEAYTPYLGAFSIEGNVVTAEVRAGADRESPVVGIRPSSTLFTVVTETADNVEGGLRISRAPRENRILVRGRAPAGRTVRGRFAIWRPQEVFADVLLRELRQRGAAHDSTVVSFDAGAVAAIPIGGVGHSLTEVLAAANKDSDNLSAECLLRALAFAGGRRAVRATDGLEAMEKVLREAGIPAADFSLRDGSGISFYNLLTARGLGRLLRVMAKHRSSAAYLASLSVAGVDGTLRRRPAGPRAGTVRAKTGTVRGVSALSGYAQAPGGRLLSFVILVQNFAGKAAPYREIQDRIVGHCLEYSAATAAVRQPR